MKKTSYELSRSIVTSSSSQEIIEETPMKDENDIIPTEKMTRDIQRLALRLRSSIPCKIKVEKIILIFLSFQCMIFPSMIINRLNQLLFIYLK
jgi:hypothetical protein